MEPAAPGGAERLTAEQMDEQRRQNVAYQYLCHLEEAKRWMETCLGQELPPPTELEERLRNGVLLAKLGHCFAPTVVPLKKIYDPDQARYKASGLHFRHTDNINHWRDAMSHVGLPLIFHPETTDIYDKKNMPRVVYCIHALSLFLFKLGLAPQIQDLYGKVDFTEEEISNVKKELEHYGLQLPAFSKLGGILAKELSGDQAAVHAAVLAINEAVARGVVPQTMAALSNPNAMLLNLRPPLADAYQEVLLQAKLEKSSSARNRYLQVSPEGEDLYDLYLTQAEIQGHINNANVHGALEEVDDALERQDPAALYQALQDPVLALHCLRRDNLEQYLEQLSTDREQKALELGYMDLLDQEEVEVGILAANKKVEEEDAMLQAVGRINAALRQGMPAQTLAALRDPGAQLPEVYPFAAALYQCQLAQLQQQQHPEGELEQEELFVAVEMLSAVAMVNRALDARDPAGLWSCLLSPALGLSALQDSNAQRYFEDLLQLRCQCQQAGAAFLSWNAIQDCVHGTNSSVQDEHQRVLAVRLINEALLQGDPERTLAALVLPAAALPGIALPTAQHYHHVLAQAQRMKAQATGDDEAELWWEEIHEAVCRANQDTLAARRMALGMAAINQAIKEGKEAQTLRVLCNPDVALRGVVRACANAYQQQLAALMGTKRQSGSTKPCWVQHQLKDGAKFYLNLQSLEGSWQCPPQGALNTTHLSREEIQLVISQVTSGHDRGQLWASNEAFVVRLQALLRGFLARRQLLALQQQHSAASRIQACWRGFKQHRAYQERLQQLQGSTKAVIKIQAWVRMWLARSRYQARLNYFRQNVEAVVKIQAFVRAHRARGHCRQLAHARSPPLGIIRHFAHLLEQSQEDLWEELEVLRLQEEVVRRLQASRQLEADLDLMDIKIGLLVKNRITLQEAMSHCKKLTKKTKEQLAELMGRDRQKGLKALSKEKRQKLEAYQNLFYLLQTQPLYLARLLCQLPHTSSLEPLIFSLYNFASTPREAFLLLQLFRAALQEEISSKVDHPQDILTSNPSVLRLVLSFYRQCPGGQEAVRQLLGGAVQEVLQEQTLSILTDPVDIYKAWINQTETESGQRSKLPYEVSPEQALSHPEVQSRLQSSIQKLLTLTEKFVSAITSAADKIPYGLRYVAKVLRTSLREKFPEAPAEDLDKVVGNLLCYRFLSPAVVAPEGFALAELPAGLPLQPSQRRNLASIARLLQQAATCQPFAGDSSHLGVLNQYLQDTHHKFRSFIAAACCVPEPAERFGLDEYSELEAVAKPLLHITVGQLLSAHQLLLQHQSCMAPEQGDLLQQLLEQLGETPTAQELVGESFASPGGSSPEEVLCQLSRVEITLTLSSKLLPAASTQDNDTKVLLLSTKQMLVDVLQCQPGESLQEILWAPASEQQEASHAHLMKKRAQQVAQTPARLQCHPWVAASCQLSLEEKKLKLLRNLRRLEGLGQVSSAHCYQELLEQLAQDVCERRRRRQRRRGALRRLRQTLQALRAAGSSCQQRRDCYQEYLSSCLRQLATGTAQGAAAPPGALLRLRKRRLQPLHYTAAQLWHKGVLLQIQDLPLCQYKNLAFAISPCQEPGSFQVTAKFLGVEMEKFQLHYQDLLQLQYEGVAVMKMFGKAKVNVNLLLFLLNEKLFKK